MGVLDFLTWWKRETLGTALFTWRKGEFVGTDAYGNRYFQEKNPRARRRRRWVLYRGEVEGSKVPAEWHAWLHHTSDQVPSDSASHRDWEKTSRCQSHRHSSGVPTTWSGDERQSTRSNDRRLRTVASELRRDAAGRRSLIATR